MEKFTSYEKLSKKERKKLDAAGRNGWNGINPAARVVKSKKLYNRKNRRNESCDFVFYSAL